MKHTTPKTVARFGLDSLVSVGEAGTAFCLSNPPEGFPVDGTPAVAQWRGFKASGVSSVEIGTLHGAGEASGLAEWDSCLFTSHRGHPVRVLPLRSALKEGAVKEHRMLLRGLGPEREITVYLPAGISPGMRSPKFVASPDVPAGRVESRLVLPDRRNASYVGHLVPLAFKRVSAAAAPAPAPAPAKPAKAPAPVKAPAKGGKK